MPFRAAARLPHERKHRVIKYLCGDLIRVQVQRACTDCSEKQRLSTNPNPTLTPHTLSINLSINPSSGQLEPPCISMRLKLRTANQIVKDERDHNKQSLFNECNDFFPQAQPNTQTHIYIHSRFEIQDLCWICLVWFHTHTHNMGLQTHVTCIPFLFRTISVTIPIK